MNIEKTINGTEATLALEGWLDTQTSPELGKVLEELDSSITDLTLDFSKLEYISSAGLRQIVASHKKVGGNLKITNMRPEIEDVFRMTGFDKRINIVK